MRVEPVPVGAARLTVVTAHHGRVRPDLCHAVVNLDRDTRLGGRRAQSRGKVDNSRHGDLAGVVGLDVRPRVGVAVGVAVGELLVQDDLTATVDDGQGLDVHGRRGRNPAAEHLLLTNEHRHATARHRAKQGGLGVSTGRGRSCRPGRLTRGRVVGRNADAAVAAGHGLRDEQSPISIQLLTPDVADGGLSEVFAAVAVVAAVPARLSVQHDPVLVRVEHRAAIVLDLDVEHLRRLRLAARHVWRESDEVDPVGLVRRGVDVAISTYRDLRWLVVVAVRRVLPLQGVPGVREQVATHRARARVGRYAVVVAVLVDGRLMDAVAHAVDDRRA